MTETWTVVVSHVTGSLPVSSEAAAELWTDKLCMNLWAQSEAERETAHVLSNCLWEETMSCISQSGVSQIIPFTPQTSGTLHSLSQRKKAACFCLGGNTDSDRRGGGSDPGPDQTRGQGVYQLILQGLFPQTCQSSFYLWPLTWFKDLSHTWAGTWSCEEFSSGNTTQTQWPGSTAETWVRVRTGPRTQSDGSQPGVFTSLWLVPPERSSKIWFWTHTHPTVGWALTSSSFLSF